MQYKLVVAESGGNFKTAVIKIQEMVNEEMKNGWLPQGGVSITDYPATAYQAMIKK